MPMWYIKCGYGNVYRNTATCSLYEMFGYL